MQHFLKCYIKYVLHSWIFLTLQTVVRYGASIISYNKEGIINNITKRRKISLGKTFNDWNKKFALHLSGPHYFFLCNQQVYLAPIKGKKKCCTRDSFIHSFLYSWCLCCHSEVTRPSECTNLQQSLTNPCLPRCLHKYSTLWSK
jgi:hypothetical protein